MVTPIILECRKLNIIERRYTVQEKEIIVVVHCLHSRRYYLLGSKFVTKTNNVMEFDYVMEYNLGCADLVADTLSCKTKPKK